jgi:hypothetical protein
MARTSKPNKSLKSKRKKSASRSAAPKSPSRVGTWMRSMRDRHGKTLAGVLFALVTLAAVIVGGGAAFSAMQARVLQDPLSAGRIPYHVELCDAPDWLPSQLHRDIVSRMTPADRSYGDPDICRHIAELAAENPWIARVREVRRHRREDGTYGVISVSAEIRRPAAMVRYRGKHCFVDRAGVLLPTGEVPRWRLAEGGRYVYYVDRDAMPVDAPAEALHYILIDGVEAKPGRPGQVWPGEDLQAGLRLIDLVGRRPYVREITVVDVRNHDKRISDVEPELRMYAQVGQGMPTDIRFGRFPRPNGGDYVVSPQRKLMHLDQYVADHGGRLAGMNSYIDVRYDELRTSWN